MIEASTVIAVMATVICFMLFRSFTSKYSIGLYYIDKLEEHANNESSSSGAIDINLLRPSNYDHAIDLRGAPTHQCVCGCNIWNLKAIFDNFEIATYFIDMECANCGSLATAPTPVDREAGQ